MTITLGHAKARRASPNPGINVFLPRQSETAVKSASGQGLYFPNTVWPRASKPSASYREANCSTTQKQQKKNMDKMRSEYDDRTVIFNASMRTSDPTIISGTSVITHNFPSLKERTKTLSFFSVTSSWQSGEMTLLQTEQTRVQMRRKRGKTGGEEEVYSLDNKACYCSRKMAAQMITNMLPINYRLTR